MTRSNSLEVVVLENLIGRLYNLLPEETKHILVTEFDDLENPSWLPVARFLPSKTKSFLQTRLACVLNEIPTAFAELQRQPTVQNWDHIVNYVRINFSFLFLSFLFSFSDDFNRIIIFHIWKTKLMPLAGKLNYTEEQNIIDILSQIWNSIASTIEIFEGRQLDILSELILKLFVATQPQKIQDNIFFSVCSFFFFFLISYNNNLYIFIL